MGGQESAGGNKKPGKISSFCQDGGCIEVVDQDGLICLLNTSPESRSYVVSATYAEWEAFIKGVKAGEFDLDKIPQGGTNG